LEGEVGFALEARVSHTIVVSSTSLPVIFKKPLESDDEDETDVNQRGSIQEFDTHSGSFTLSQKGEVSMMFFRARLKIRKTFSPQREPLY